MAKDKGPTRSYSSGKVKLNVWVNKGDKYDSIAYSPVKNYKAGKGDEGEWKTTTSFSLVDLADLELCIQAARLAERIKTNGGTSSGSTHTSDNYDSDSPAF